MSQRVADQRYFWVFVGLMAGVSLSYFWPNEPALARGAADRDSGGKFAIITVPTQSLGGQPDAVFLLDFVTGRLMGAAMNAQSGQFTQRYARILARDFNLSPDVEPRFVVATGQLNLAGGGKNAPAQGGIYIAELNSGICNLYGFPYSITNRDAGVRPVTLLGGFPFREATITP